MELPHRWLLDLQTYCRAWQERKKIPLDSMRHQAALTGSRPATTLCAAMPTIWNCRDSQILNTMIASNPCWRPCRIRPLPTWPGGFGNGTRTQRYLPTLPLHVRTKHRASVLSVSYRNNISYYILTSFSFFSLHSQHSVRFATN